MSKLQMKEEMTAVAALLALGMLTVLAGGLRAEKDNCCGTAKSNVRCVYGFCICYDQINKRIHCI